MEPDLQIERDELVYNEEEDSVGGGSRSEVFEATLKKRGIERQVAVKVFRDFRRRLGGAEKLVHIFKLLIRLSFFVAGNTNSLKLKRLFFSESNHMTMSCVSLGSVTLPAIMLS